MLILNSHIVVSFILMGSDVDQAYFPKQNKEWNLMIQGQ